MTAPASEGRTYDATLLTLLDPSNLDFARTYARTLLRDMPEMEVGGTPLGSGQPLRPRQETWPEFSRLDVQIDSALLLDAVRDESGKTYFRPHFTAARLYLGDPNLWKSRAVDGSSESRRDSMEIVRAWLAQGAGLDALIPSDVPLPPFEGAKEVAVTRKSERLTTVVVPISGGW